LPPQNLTSTGKRQGLLFTLLFSNNSKILTPPPSHIHTLVRSFTFSDNNIIRLSSLDRLRTSIDFRQSHPFVKTGGVVPASAPGFATPGSLNYRSAEAWPGCLLGSGLMQCRQSCQCPSNSPAVQYLQVRIRHPSHMHVPLNILRDLVRARDLHR
jgi:hypothetical protein